MVAGTVIPVHVHPCDEYVYVLDGFVETGGHEFDILSPVERGRFPKTSSIEQILEWLTVHHKLRPLSSYTCSRVRLQSLIVHQRL